MGEGPDDAETGKPACRLGQKRQHHDPTHENERHLAAREAEDAQVCQFARAFRQLDARAVIGDTHDNQRRDDDVDGCGDADAPA